MNKIILIYLPHVEKVKLTLLESTVQIRDLCRGRQCNLKLNHKSTQELSIAIVQLEIHIITSVCHIRWQSNELRELWELYGFLSPLRKTK